MANLVTFAKKLWKDATSGGTPITAAELNRMEGGINDCATQINKLGDSVSRLDVKKKTITETTNENGNVPFSLIHNVVILYAECVGVKGANYDNTSVVCVPYSFTTDGVGCCCFSDKDGSKIRSTVLTIDVYYINAQHSVSRCTTFDKAGADSISFAWATTSNGANHLQVRVNNVLVLSLIADFPDEQYSVSRVTLRSMTEIRFKVFETCFEIWFVVEPGNAYIVSLPSESATDKKCQLVHEKNGIRTTIKTFQFSVSPFIGSTIYKITSLVESGIMLQIRFSASDGKSYGFSILKDGIQLWNFTDNVTVLKISKQHSVSRYKYGTVSAKVEANSMWTIDVNLDSTPKATFANAMSANKTVRAQAKTGADGTITIVVVNGESYVWEGSVSWFAII